MNLQKTPKNNAQLCFETSEDHPVTPRGAIENSSYRRVAEVSCQGDAAERSITKGIAQSPSESLRRDGCDVVADVSVGPDAGAYETPWLSLDAAAARHRDDGTEVVVLQEGYAYGTVTGPTYGCIQHHPPIEYNVTKEQAAKDHRQRTSFERITGDRAAVVVARATEQTNLQEIDIYYELLEKRGRVLRDQAVLNRSVTVASSYLRYCVEPDWVLVSVLDGLQKIWPAWSSHFDIEDPVLVWKGSDGYVADVLSSMWHARGLNSEAVSGRARRAVVAVSNVTRFRPATIRLVAPSIPASPIILGSLS